MKIDDREVNYKPDNNDLKSGKEKLSHVETKSSSSANPIFKCQDCGYIGEIPADVLKKMDNDEPFQKPDHHNKPMHISVRINSCETNKILSVRSKYQSNVKGSVSRQYVSRLE